MFAFLFPMIPHRPASASETFMKKWTDRVRSALKHKGWKYRQLSDGLNVTEAAISMYLTGRREPTLAQIRKIATMLDMSVSELVGDDALFISDPDQIQATEIIKKLPKERRELALRLLQSLLEEKDTITK